MRWTCALMEDEHGLGGNGSGSLEWLEELFLRNGIGNKNQRFHTFIIHERY
jgi:hypothetical protein